ncbi:MAG TPA: MAPEG family protein [Gammaproteobacteria bacterium]|nr:MAPEG family protein [Xanthomonadales bacterium]MCB1593854.1 MAPEG family protein [Xanthomonadales bacterium]HPI96636.1 MAPEG family protein [Gammaproteobacteria bacterium]
MNTKYILYIMFIHVCWTFLLYAILTILRAPQAWNLDTKSRKINSLKAYEPKVSDNLSNQFEWPLLFYTSCILIIVLNVFDYYQFLFAVVFLGGRILHSFVHIFTDNIRLRGAVFTINFMAVFLMWFRLIFTI